MAENIANAGAHKPGEPKGDGSGATVHELKPRAPAATTTTTRGRGRKAVGSEPDPAAPAKPSPPPPGDNSESFGAADADPEKALREALQLQLVGLRGKHRKVDLEIEAMMEEVHERKAFRKQIRTAIETAGMPLHIFDPQYEASFEPRTDQREKERLREICREAFGLPIGPERQLPLGASSEEADRRAAADWESEGYRASIAGEDPKPPSTCPPEYGQAFMRGYQNGQRRNAEGLRAVDARMAADAARLKETGGEGGSGEGGSGSGPQIDLEEAARENAAVGGGSPTRIVNQPPMDGDEDGSWAEASPEELKAQAFRRARQADPGDPAAGDDAAPESESTTTAADLE